MNRAPCDGSDLGVVRDDNYRAAPLVQVSQYREHFPARGGIEVSRRLVGQDQIGVGDQCARDRNPLLLAAGKLRRAVFDAIAKADRLQCVDGEASSIARVAVQQRQLDVAPGRQLGQQLELLEDKPDPMVPLGKGTQNIPAIAKAAAANIDWMVIEMDVVATDVFAAIKDSYDYLVTNKFAET